MSDRDPNHLCPYCRERWPKVKAAIEAALPYTAGLSFVLRTQEEQDALHAQGRMPTDNVNRIRARVNWPPLKPEENKCVTWVTKSKHQPNAQGFSEAGDIVLQTKDGKAMWDPKADANANHLPDWKEIGAIIEAQGLKWGGRWGDMCHFEKP
jgi:hypothetical protein